MVNKELLAYIRRELERGVLRKDIREILINKGGWTSLDVVEAMMEIDNEKGHTPTMPEKRATVSEKTPAPTQAGSNPQDISLPMADEEGIEVKVHKLYGKEAEKKEKEAGKQLTSSPKKSVVVASALLALLVAGVSVYAYEKILSPQAGVFEVQAEKSDVVADTGDNIALEEMRTNTSSSLDQSQFELAPENPTSAGIQKDESNEYLSIKQLLRNIALYAEYRYESLGSYDGLCDLEVARESLRELKEINGGGNLCRDSIDSWAAHARVPTGGMYCIDPVNYVIEGEVVGSPDLGYTCM